MQTSGLEQGRNAEFPLFPALAMLFFFAGSFLFFEAKHFGLELGDRCRETHMLLLLLAAGVLQFSVPALVLLPGAAILCGLLSAACAREMLLTWQLSRLGMGLLPLLASVVLFFALFQRGMAQSLLVSRALLERDRGQRRALLCSCLIMLGLAGVYLLFRFIMQ